MRSLQQTFDKIAGLRSVLVASACIITGARDAAAASLGTCTIVISNSGNLKPSADLKSLSTKNAGGAAGRATITANAGGVLPSTLCTIGLPLNCMQVSVTGPSNFSAAPFGGSTNVSMNSSFSQVGSSSLLNLSSLVILNGTYSFDFDLTATKSSGIFGAGTYQAQQIVRCE